MFEKKCPNCGRKIEKGFSFCPYCGFNIEEKNRNKYGLLGRDDNLNINNSIGLPFGFNKIFSSLLKQVDKQFQELDKRIGEERTNKKKKPKLRKKGFSINISTGTGKKPEIKVSGFGPGMKNFGKKIKPKKKKSKIKQPKLSKEKKEKLASLPREEASTTVRRMSNKIIYEISLPEVKDEKNLAINKLENSIEIKAFGKDKVYFKLLPVSLSISRYKLKNEKLILELES